MRLDVGKKSRNAKSYRRWQEMAYSAWKKVAHSQHRMNVLLMDWLTSTGPFLDKNPRLGQAYN